MSPWRPFLELLSRHLIKENSEGGCDYTCIIIISSHVHVIHIPIFFKDAPMGTGTVCGKDSRIRWFYWMLIGHRLVFQHRISSLQHTTMSKIRTIFRTWDLWKWSRSCKQLCLLCPPDPWNIPGSRFQSSRELWNPLRNTVLSKCIFVGNKGPVNIWNQAHK